MQNAGLDEAQAGIRLLGEISTTSDMHIFFSLFDLYLPSAQRENPIIQADVQELVI